MSPSEDPTATPASAPSPGGHLARDDASAPNVLPTVRASDSDRNAVAERLRDAFADGRLDETEFDVRMQQALTARTREDLGGLLGDLGVPEPPAQQPAATTPVDASASNLPNYGFSMAVMGGVERKGRWRVPAETTVVAIMGGASLDLRAATLTSQVTTVRAVAVMGGVEIIVPQGVRVEINGIPLMGGGGRDRSIDDADLPSTAPLIRVRYLALMGGVGVSAKSASDRRDTQPREVHDRQDAHLRAMTDRGADRQRVRHDRREARLRAMHDRRDAQLRRMQRRERGHDDPPPDPDRSA